jgi:hypothetical protein
MVEKTTAWRQRRAADMRACRKRQSAGIALFYVAADETTYEMMKRFGGLDPKKSMTSKPSAPHWGGCYVPGWRHGWSATPLAATRHIRGVMKRKRCADQGRNVVAIR